ncbi:SsgA family sporulation/cell division regulator [Nonomuraea sp. NPDC047529]|uniref:SsgA family sporulation/cell division regulator n=1 Tax=Nonomuraea sp. NPDC047529 TaxID=3155623 RepID=UPI0033E1D3FE
MKAVTSVTKALTLWPVDRRDQPVHATLFFDAGDPYAVQLLFPQSEGVLPWVFGRALLIDGLETTTGQGDVQIAPGDRDGWLIVTLLPEQAVLLPFFASRAVVEQFIDATYEVVRLGCEDKHVDWNAELAAMLGHQVEVTLREADNPWGRTRTGTLATDVDDAGVVVFTFPSSTGTPVTWRMTRERLTAQVWSARRARQARSRTLRLVVPGDVELLLPVEAAQEFLTARFETALDGAS